MFYFKCSYMDLDISKDRYILFSLENIYKRILKCLYISTILNCLSEYLKITLDLFYRFFYVCLNFSRGTNVFSVSLECIDFKLRYYYYKLVFFLVLQSLDFEVN